MWLVDWDIQSKKRGLFYYHLKKIRKKYGLYGAMSSQSVMLIDDESVAREVYELADKFGQASLYRVEKVNGEEGEKIG